MRSNQLRTFGGFQLDPANERLWRGGQAIALRPKAFAVLKYLVDHRGQLVTKQQLLDNVAASFPKVVEELVPNLLNLGTVLRVVKNLLKEQVSVRDLRAILETLADYAPITKDADVLTEFVRQNMGRVIVDQFTGEDDLLSIITLDRQVEEVVAEAVQVTEQGSYLAIEPEVAQQLLAAIRQTMERFDQSGTQPVLIASPNIRRHLKRFTERFIPNLTILSHNEIPPHVKIQSLGVVSIHAS